MDDLGQERRRCAAVFSRNTTWAGPFPHGGHVDTATGRVARRFHVRPFRAQRLCMRYGVRFAEYKAVDAINSEYNGRGG